MNNTKAVRLGGDSDVVAYVFRTEETHWVCMRSLSAEPTRGWIECWSSKDGTEPNVVDLLNQLAALVRDHLKRGPFGPYLDRAHFFSGWDTWGGAAPGRIAQYRPSEIAEFAEPPIDIDDLSPGA